MTVRTQFCYDLHVDPLAVMADHGVPVRARPRVLRLLSGLHDIAARNAKRGQT